MNDLFSLKNKVAIVTGAARGNGKAIAEGLLQAGAQVILHDVLKEELHDTWCSFTKDYGNLFVRNFHGDLTIDKDFKAFTEYISYVFNEIGSIDVLVNNAGITMGSHSLDCSLEEWQKTLKINLEIPFRLSQFVGNYMVQLGRGSVINITSLNAEQGFGNNPAYVTSKGGLKQLTKALAVDLGLHQIRVNNVGPGYIRTDMTQKSFVRNRRTIEDKTMLGRWGEPEDLKGIVVFLASDSSFYITGQDFYVDGGWLAKGLG